MALVVDFATGFLVTSVVCTALAEVRRQVVKGSRRGDGAGHATVMVEDVVTRLAPDLRPVDRGSRLLDKYEVAVQDRVHLELMLDWEQSAERKAVLEDSLRRMTAHAAGVRELVTRDLLYGDAGEAAR